MVEIVRSAEGAAPVTAKLGKQATADLFSLTQNCNFVTYMLSCSGDAFGAKFPLSTSILERFSDLKIQIYNILFIMVFKVERSPPRMQLSVVRLRRWLTPSLVLLLPLRVSPPTLWDWWLVEEKFGEQNFRVFGEMRGKFLYYNPKNSKFWVKMQSKMKKPTLPKFEISILEQFGFTKNEKSSPQNLKFDFNFEFWG